MLINKYATMTTTIMTVKAKTKRRGNFKEKFAQTAEIDIAS